MSSPDHPPTRFALLSFAHYHANFWAEAIGQMPGEAVLSGIWDDDLERGRAAAARFGVRFEENLERLLAESDAAGITSETSKHRFLIEACANAGVHVFCEKPLATTPADADAILEVAAEGQIIVRQSFPKRTDPINDELRDLVNSGELGNIMLVRIRHGHRHGLDPAFRRQWYANAALSGGGTLLDEGIHAADLLRQLFGAPQSVSATLVTHLPDLEVEDTACAMFRWDGGLIADVTTSWAFVAGESSIEVFGTGGTAVVDGVDIASRVRATPPFLRWYRPAGETIIQNASAQVPRFVSGGFHQEGPTRFVRMLRGGTDGLATVQEARAALDMIFAAYRSAASGRFEHIGRTRV